MKALTLTQPWATLVALGSKKVETRSWRTHYRGRLAIHAAKGFPRLAKEFAMHERTLGRLPPYLPRGAVLCTVELRDCLPVEEVAPDVTALERLYGDYSIGRWAWVLENVEVFDEPIFTRGSLGLWNWELEEALGE